MLRNYLKIALRTIARNRLFSTLNILGLSVGVAACWVVLNLVQYEFSIDAFHKNKDRIFRVVSLFKVEGKEFYNSGIPKAMPYELGAVIPEAELVVPHFEKYIAQSSIPMAAGAAITYRDETHVVLTDGRYFEMFEYKWLAGSPITVLEHPNEVVLTQKRAATYFPNATPEQVLGHSVVYADSIEAKIVGVVADFTQASDFDQQEFLSIKSYEKGDWKSDWQSTNSNNQCLVLLHSKENIASIESKISALSARDLEQDDDIEFERHHQLQALSDIHFDGRFASRIEVFPRSLLYGLVVLALFILLLAVINFVNLSTAQAPRRAKEIGIRKTLGSGRRALVAQFLGETFVLTALAFGIAFLLQAGFTTFFEDFLPDGIEDYMNSPQVLLGVVGLWGLVSVFAGAYPAWLSARFEPVKILRGQPFLQIGSFQLGLRKSLIVFQFIVAQAFIFGALIIGQQLQYAMKKDFGFQKDAILTLRIPWQTRDKPAYAGKKEVLKDELSKIPNVELVSLADPPISMSMSNNTFKLKKSDGTLVSKILHRKRIDKVFIDMYDLTIVAGVGFQRDSMNEYVINESAVRAMGFETAEAAVGQLLAEDGGEAYPIIGVVNDFHTDNLYHSIQPHVFMTNELQYNNFMNIRLTTNTGNSISTTMQRIEALYNRHYAGWDFDAFFLDETLATLYETELKISKIVQLATVISIFISCLGLFGLITLNVLQRTKEIGIRKVLGASVASVIGLLSTDFLKLVGLASMIALPATFYLVQYWLEGFVYRIEVQWWHFVVAACATLVVAFVTMSFQSVKAALRNPTEALKVD